MPGPGPTEKVVEATAGFRAEAPSAGLSGHGLRRGWLGELHSTSKRIRHPLPISILSTSPNISSGKTPAINPCIPLELGRGKITV